MSLAWLSPHDLICRALIVVAAVAIVAIVFFGRERRGPADDWGWLLEPHGVDQVHRVTAVGRAEPGRWHRAIAEVAPAVGEDGDPGDNSDIVTFEALTTREGAPLAVRRVANVTRTPHAHEQVVAVANAHGPRALVAVRTHEGIGSIATLELDGDTTAARLADGSPRNLGDRLRIAVVHAQESGHWSGITRRTFTLQPAAAAVEAHFRQDEGGWLVRFFDEAGEQTGWAELSDGLLASNGATQVHDATEPWVLGKWSTWAAARARAEPRIGATRVALAEAYALDVIELGRRAWYGAVGVDADELKEELGNVAETDVVMPKQLALAEGSIDVGGATAWPPADIAPLAELEAVEGEGRWIPWVPPWSDALPPYAGPWPLVQTTIRVDPKRQYDYVTLIAMDLRQLELHLVAGTHNPRSTTGIRGTGRVPTDADTLSRLVLAFNGGFKTSHGAYGMMLDRRVFIPPKPATATVSFHDDGSIRMGTWPGKAPLGNYRKEMDWAFTAAKEGDAVPPPDDMVSYRQNLPPLVAGGKINPEGARRWGGSVDHLTSSHTPRSGLCIYGDGTLVFVWGRRTSAMMLGKAMLRAGCTYGMHLDMNPFHTGIVQYRVPIEDGQVPEEDDKLGFVGAEYDVPVPRMWFDWHRWLRADLKDFFYVVRRPTLRARLPSPPPAYDDWETRGMPVMHDGVVRPALVATASGAAIFAFDIGQLEIRSSDTELVEPPVGTIQFAHAASSTDHDAELTLRDGRLAIGSGDGEVLGAVTLVARDGRPLSAADEPGDGTLLVGVDDRGRHLLVAVCDACVASSLVGELLKVGARDIGRVATGAADVTAWANDEWVAVQRPPYPPTDRRYLLVVPRQLAPVVAPLTF